MALTSPLLRSTSISCAWVYGSHAGISEQESARALRAKCRGSTRGSLDPRVLPRHLARRARADSCSLIPAWDPYTQAHEMLVDRSNGLVSAIRRERQSIASRIGVGHWELPF